MIPHDKDALLAKIDGRPVIVNVSGGKDSAATCLYLMELGIPIHARLFQDTKWEHPSLYEYLRGPLAEKIGPITEVSNPKGGFADLVRKRAMFPSRQRRFCTQELKVYPARDYLRGLIDQYGEVINAVGIRHEESSARAKMPEWEFSDTFDCDVWRPLISWTEQDVIDIHQRHGLRPWSGYLGLKGKDGRTYPASRAGCWPCIFARKAELRMVAEVTPERVDEIRALEAEIESAARERYAARGETFESLGYHPPSMYQARLPSIGPDGKQWPAWPIDKVVEWSRTPLRKGEAELFDDPDRGCMRWGMCEASSGGQTCHIEPKEVPPEPPALGGGHPMDPNKEAHDPPVHFYDRDAAGGHPF